MKKIRYGDYLKEVSTVENKISFNKIYKTKELSDKKFHLTGVDYLQILKPYVTPRFFDQLKVVLPVVFYLCIFQLVFLKTELEDEMQLLLGFSCVVFGLMIFLEGITVGLIPLAELLGKALPVKQKLYSVLFISFTLGLGLAFAEPAISIIQQTGQFLTYEKSPFLYYIINEKPLYLTIAIGIGVGLSSMIGSLIFIFQIPMKLVIIITLCINLIITYWAFYTQYASELIGIAWDAGAIATGPITATLVVSFGIGLSNSLGNKTSALGGLGIASLAHLIPSTTVLLLYFIIPRELYLNFTPTLSSNLNLSLFDHIKENIYLTLRAIVPLLFFLIFILKVVLKEKLKNLNYLIYGFLLLFLGMFIFNL